MRIDFSRFLQAPGGQVSKGETRKYADGNVVYKMKKHIETAKECQFLNVNYKKSGQVCSFFNSQQPFVNLITVIPVPIDDKTDMISHFVGFQVDLLEQSYAILSRLSGISSIFNQQMIDMS